MAIFAAQRLRKCRHADASSLNTGRMGRRMIAAG